MIRLRRQNSWSAYEKQNSKKINIIENEHRLINVFAGYDYDIIWEQHMESRIIGVFFCIWLFDEFVGLEAYGSE